MCTITGELMKEPVCTATGETYEREAIMQWFRTHKSDPNSNTLLASKKLTPNKPLDAARKFAELRYYQVESYVPTPRALVQADGVKIVNVHQGNYLNPWIIYPLDPVANAEMRNYSSQCRTHAPPEADVKIKTYYSSGSMSFITECLWAFFALGNEVIASPNIAVDPIPPPIPPTPLPMIAPPPPPSCANIKNFVDCHPHPGGEASCIKMGCCWQRNIYYCLF